MSTDDLIISAIDASPLNAGLSGADWLDHEGNVPIVIGEDVALFDDEGDGIYQVHFLFVSRGKAALASAKESFKQMFERYGADLIIGPRARFPRRRENARSLGGRKIRWQARNARGAVRAFCAVQRNVE
jgi:hypothetical protein